jgi:hypothetical protein
MFHILRRVPKKNHNDKRSQFLLFLLLYQIMQPRTVSGWILTNERTVHFWRPLVERGKESIHHLAKQLEEPWWKMSKLKYICKQGRRNDVKARGADFRERALLNWYILRDVCKTSGVELRLIIFSIYWMIGVWGGSPPGDCAILEARWLHFLRFLKQIRKRIALTFLTIRYFAKAIL